MNVISSAFKGVRKNAYFPFARYFAFWAKIVLRRWQPRVIVVTGSSGKTTMLHMLEAQIGTFAKLSHGANSAFGIPLDILGLDGVRGSRWRWLKLIVLAPLRSLRRPGEAYYVAEADADRPGEAGFLAELLTPEVTIWVSAARSHSVGFEALAEYRQQSVEQVIAEEFAKIPKRTSGLILADGDNPRIVEALSGELDAKLLLIKRDQAVESYKLHKKSTVITLASKATYRFSQPQPPVVGHQIAYLDELMKYLEIEPDYEFSRLDYPPGRSSVFTGKNGFTIIDSTYNINLSSARAVLELFAAYPAKKRVLVLGDLTEQGSGEAAEHEALAKLIIDMKLPLDQIILYGRRVGEYTYPILNGELKIPVTKLVKPLDVLNFLESELSGDETVMFKGAGFMEGIIARLLKNPADAQYLPRRGSVWDKRRSEYGI